MDLQTTFYLAGIVFFIVSIGIVLAIGVFVFLMYKRVFKFFVFFRGLRRFFFRS